MAVAGILLVLVPVSAMADAGNGYKNSGEVEGPIQKQYKYNGSGPVMMQERAGFLNQCRYRYMNSNGEPNQDAQRLRAKVRGVWGFSDDNESDGCFTAQIAKGLRAGVFRGVYNKTGSEDEGTIIARMRAGFFNGKITTPAGEEIRITGLYHINRDEQTFKLRWMTPGASGWADGELVLP